MAVLKLKPAPKFKAKVAIPIPGGDSALVEFEFKHRTRSEMDAFLQSADTRSDVESVLESVCGWELTDPFNRENVERLIENYQGAPRAIAETYLRELMGLRLGN